MARAGRLANPPIKEALVDLRVLPVVTREAALFETLREEFRQTYPNSSPIHRLQAHFEAQAGQIRNTRTEDLGFQGLILRDEADSKVAQFRNDGFTLSQLSGYTTADDLFTEAMQLWAAFIRVARPKAIGRIALRYINSIALPFRHGDHFGRFLTGAPTMPPGAPSDIADFLSRVVLHIDQPIESTGIVTQKLEHSTASVTPFVLDVDVFKTGEFGVNPHTVEPILHQLRECKNRLFFTFLTDEALEPYR